MTKTAKFLPAAAVLWLMAKVGFGNARRNKALLVQGRETIR